MRTESFIKLRKLTVSDDEPIEDIVKRGAEEFRGMSGGATVELRLIDADGTKARTSFSVQLTPAGPTVVPRSVQTPEFVAITTPEAFRRMADGSYSPFQAHLDGNLKVHGNAELGRQIVRHLAGSGTQGATCNPILYDPSYNPVGPDGGSLTLSGCCFTPGGDVVLYYNFGSGEYESVVAADSNGQFTWLQPGIFCGPLTTDPNVGVIVTATDLSSGKSTTQGYPTPC
jgi:hypothetical protein